MFFYSVSNNTLNNERRKHKFLSGFRASVIGALPQTPGFSFIVHAQRVGFKIPCQDPDSAAAFGPFPALVSEFAPSPG